jgi:hypothetical protein
MQLAVGNEVGLLRTKVWYTERHEFEIRLGDGLIKDTFQWFPSVSGRKQTLLKPPFDAVFTFRKTWRNSNYTQVGIVYTYCQLCRYIQGSPVEIRDKWVPVTTAWPGLNLRMEERPPIWRLAANILNKQSRTAEKGWSSRLGVGRDTNNSSP